jgi:4-oxalocrotonate tautomerase
MPIVQIHMLEGRSTEQKRALAQKVTDAVCESVNCPPEAVKVIISNMAFDDYAEAGVLKSDKK